MMFINNIFCNAYKMLFTQLNGEIESEMFYFSNQ